MRLAQLQANMTGSSYVLVKLKFFHARDMGIKSALAIRPERVKAASKVIKVFFVGLLKRTFQRTRHSKKLPPMRKRCAEDQAKKPKVTPHSIPHSNRVEVNIFTVIIPKSGMRKNGQKAM